MRCYAPSTSVIVALLFAGYLALRHTAGHALDAGLLTTVIIAGGGCLLAAGLIVVRTATIRQRRAAAGGCLTCSHPCQELPPAPAWPDRPLTRAALPVVVIPQQRPAEGAERVTLPG